MLERKYGVILADPPWQFKVWSAKGKGRSAETHYDCLSFERLCAVPVQEWAADDCTLFLWTTDPMLPKALELIKAWGFRYKTVGFYWVKTRRMAYGARLDDNNFTVGLGFWTRANPETCLLATRGYPKRLARDVRRLVIAPRREHSRKPDEIYPRIERLVAGPYLEMFARQKRECWDAWGDETDKFDADHF